MYVRLSDKRELANTVVSVTTRCSKKSQLANIVVSVTTRQSEKRQLADTVASGGNNKMVGEDRVS